MAANDMATPPNNDTEECNLSEQDGVSDTNSQESGPDSAVEFQRLLEVARYYCTVPDEGATLSLPPLEESCEDNLPIPNLDPIRPPALSVDPALTAFAQLGALKLECDRSFISIIDDNQQYILAEATRSISLEDKDNHKDDDAIYLGIQVLPVYWGVCPGTMQTFTDTEGKHALETANVSANKTRYVIRNFLADERYRDRPYVASWPFMRFYAEVPVKSPRGMVIGSYCVVDNKPRDVFGDSSIKVLEEIARSISHYLELTRMRLDYDRAVKLMTGLSSFVDIQRSGYDGRPRLPEQANSKQSSPGDFPSEASGSDTTIPSAQTEEFEAKPPPPRREDSDVSASGSTESESTNEVAIKIKQTFQRASNLICGSLELDATTFYDAYVCNRSNLNRQLHAQNQLGSDTPTSSGDDEQHSIHPQGHHQRHYKSAHLGGRSSHRSSDSSGVSSAEQICEVLGHTDKSSVALSASTPALPAILLQRLLQRYPVGHIFHVSKAEIHTPTASAQIKRQESVNKKHMPWKRGSKIADVSVLLFSLFPRARSIIFFPLFDSSKNLWSAACIGWTANTRRGLQDAELTYLAAFSNSIIAELGRLEAVAVGQAKTDFLGNISHELRSPLHGILAAAELLQESSTGTNQTELIGMVDSCGRTLLDTMNHLLDFAKINNFAKQKDEGLDTKAGATRHENFALVTEVDLRALVEEVVDAMFAGHVYHRKAADPFVTQGGHEFVDKKKQDVVVLLDIDPMGARWIFSTEAGAWRRLLMNIFGNSLKYTSQGLIKVTLHADAPNGGSTMLHLSVSDTGRGISKDYLKHKLYSPFSQEDSLAVGAGLGLSIVQQIVATLKGKVDVQSEISVGTTVTLSIPLKTPAGSQEQMHAQPERHPRTLQPFDGVTVCLLDIRHLPDTNDGSRETSIYRSNRKTLLRSLLKKYLDCMAGLTLLHSSFEHLVPAQIYITDEEDLVKLLSSGSGSQQVHENFKKSRLIVVRTDTSQSLPPDNGVVYLSQPFGPSKLKKALQVCLHRQKSSTPLDLSHIPRARSASQDTITVETHLESTPDTPPSSNDDLTEQHVQPSVGAHPHILLVDDNNINLKILCNLMQKLKCTYVTAVDGLHALETYKRELRSPARAGKRAFDWVLMDLSMPVMDGLTATREIRACEKSERRLPTQVVALTGLANTKTREEATASGVNMYLTKPVKLKVLKNVLGLD